MKDKIYLTVRITLITLGICISTVACTPHIVKLRGPGIHHNGVIIIYTHKMPEKMHKAIVHAGATLQRNVFKNKKCPTILVRKTNNFGFMGYSTINIFDTKDANIAPGIKFNSCREPYAAVHKQGKYGIINFCGKRIHDAFWRHALDPDIYLSLHNIVKVLGLPNTVSYRGVSSYSANDRRMRADRPGYSFLFRFKAEEKRALIKRYCNK